MKRILSGKRLEVEFFVSGMGAGVVMMGWYYFPTLLCETIL